MPVFIRARVPPVPPRLPPASAVWPRCRGRIKKTLNIFYLPY
nr:MAG TPA: hypothetical protein [Caudoviricetes sp.]